MSNLTSQSGKRISFRVSGGGESTYTLTLPINPDEVQLDHPSRSTVTQTLGGVFQDFDNTGVRTITVQGNTGWRYQKGLKTDGFWAARNLYFHVYEGYFNRLRKKDDAKLMFINTVDNYAYQVTVTDFQMLRNKSNPLLFQYTMQLTVLRTESSPGGLNTSDPVRITATNTSKKLSSGSSKATHRHKTTVVTKTHTKAPKRTYKVKSGDTLTGIAYKFYRHASYFTRISAANHITHPDRIFPGQVLIIP